MQTLFDWLTVAAFSALAVLYLERSMRPVARDHWWQYVPPALACAGANWLGNHGHEFIAAAVLAVGIGYVLVVLKPFPLGTR